MVSVVQCMDRGIIKNSKHIYRWLVGQNILLYAYLDEEETLNINFLKAACMYNSTHRLKLQKKMINNWHLSKCFCFSEGEEENEAIQKLRPLWIFGKMLDMMQVQRFCKHG